MRAAEDIEETMERCADAVWRVCALYFRSHADAQDAFQDAFLKYALADSTTFNDDEHRKAWLIRVTANVCKDMLKASSRKAAPLDEAGCERLASSDPEAQPASFSSEVVDAMRALDDPPRTPLYLSLYEGYSAVEIADMVEAPVNTVYSWLARGKKQLKEALS
ncbi:RNA polymerase sigma factor [Arabiibacter massiliensis]|uniref:RNA polymerase sigma factor n=1 Tax=Arabiibacter massiliensis TaxID=1870985 RepID=UPI0009B982B3|nr:sigma-70 family RNA polymerase sigma factor [Arabiibacter massiliensis]